MEGLLYKGNLHQYKIIICMINYVLNTADHSYHHNYNCNYNYNYKYNQ